MTDSSPFTRTTPEAVGISSAAVLRFVESLEQHAHPLEATQGFVLVRHGQVAAEGWWAPYGPELPHMMYSLSKSFTSTAIGIAVAEGLLTVDDPVLWFFPEDAPEDPSENLRAMTVKHLLSMNTGHHEDTTGAVWGGDEPNWPKAFLALPVEHKPGTWFVYNTAATYMLSAIITKLTGEVLLDYLKPRLFDPLGIENPTWDEDPEGRSIGGSGLHIRTEHIARFGQLYLQQGEWQGQQLVPQAWIAQASHAHSDNSNTQTNPDWKVGYGYQFWRCRHGAYRGDGAFGQYCVVMPEQDAVLAMTGGVSDMQAVLNLVWEHLLPAMRPAALAADDAGTKALQKKLEGLRLPVVKGDATLPQSAQWSGSTYALEGENLPVSHVTVDFGGDIGAITFRDAAGDEYRVQAGSGEWLGGQQAPGYMGVGPVATCGAWTSADTFELRVCEVEQVFCTVFRFRFGGNELQLQVEPNVSWQGKGAVTLAGRKVSE